MSIQNEYLSELGDARSRTEEGTGRDIRTDSFEMESENFTGAYEQETLPDVIGQDVDTITESTGNVLTFPYTPLEIADYMSHYFPPA